MTHVIKYAILKTGRNSFVPINDERKTKEMINLTKEEQAQADKVMSKISLDKDKAALGDHVASLSKCMIDLGKKTAVDLTGLTARVILVLDYSGSMNSLYRNGTIQNTLSRLAPLGLTFDDNGAIEVYLFQNDCKKLSDLTLQNYADYKSKVIDKSGYSMGGTNYAPVIEAVLTDTGKRTPGETRSGFLGIKKASEPVLKKTGETTLVMFVTDGDNDDKPQTDAIVRDSSKTDAFIQFIGIGDAKFNYLKKLDDLDGRDTDNTGFTNLANLNDIGDEELYRIILEEFANWTKTV